MRSRFDSTRFDTSLVGLQWALRFLLIVMAALALAACSDDGPTGGAGDIVEVVVTRPADTVERSDSLLLTAAPKRADGSVRTNVQVTWMSMNTAIATVEPRAGQKAVVVGKQAGIVTIRAMAEDKIGQTSIEVVVTAPAAPVVTAVSPAQATEGDPVTEITINGQNFNELSLVRFNSQAIPTQFISNTELRGLISPANLAQVGTAEVTVRTGPPGGGTSAGKPFNILPRVATVTVEVPDVTMWIGESAQGNATPKNTAGQPVQAGPAQWASGDDDIVAVDANGKVTALKEGLTIVAATIGGKTGSASVYVTAAPQYDLMYDSQRGGNRELWIVSLGGDATPRRWLQPGFWGEDAATSHDGTRIAFVSRDQYLNSDIWVANRDGSGLTRLTTYEGSDDQPAWSPDGSQIAYRSTKGGQSQIWIMNADGSNQRNLMGNSYNVVDAAQSSPTFGRNGRIYFQISYPYSVPSSVLASMPVDGTWQQVVHHTPVGYNDSDPAVAWDGSKILLRRKQGNNDLGLIYTDLNGNTMFSVNLPGAGFMPSWSRNDLYLTYSSSPDGLYPINVYVMKRDHFWRKRITVAEIGGSRNPIFIKS